MIKIILIDLYLSDMSKNNNRKKSKMKIPHFLLPLVVRASRQTSRSQLCCLTRFVLRLANARTLKILDATKMQHNGKAL